MYDSLSKVRAQRNSSILNIKNQEVKRRYASGKVQIDVPGTEEAMTSNTILAVPSQLVAKRGVSLAKCVTIGCYDQAGPNANLISKTTVDLQNNMADVDEAIATASKTGKLVSGKKVESKNSRNGNKAHAISNDSEFGRVVLNKNQREHKQLRPDVDLVAIAKNLLGHH